MTALTHKENDLHNRLIVAEFNLGQAEKELRRLHEENEALRARLPQPEPEPVAWHEPEAYGNVTVYEKWANENGWLPLYATPPQREWQGLTDEEIKNHWLIAMQSVEGTVLPIPEFARAIEAKLKEKNT